MPVPDCIKLMDIAEELFAHDESFQADVSAILTSDRSARGIVNAFAARLAPEDAAVLLREYEALPDYVWTTMADAWQRSRDAGVGFELRNLRPKSLTEFARRRRVELTVIAEADRIVVELSHVPNRHAEWYAPVRSAS